MGRPAPTRRHGADMPARPWRLQGDERQPAGAFGERHGGDQADPDAGLHQRLGEQRNGEAGPNKAGLVTYVNPAAAVAPAQPRQTARRPRRSRIGWPLSGTRR